jgi:hypothetical protein
LANELGPFIAGKAQKYFWVFWGEDETFTKPLKIVATSKETKERLTVFEMHPQPVNPIYGADHHEPSSIKLPSAGLWRLEVYFGEELFGDVVPSVQEKQVE